MSVVKMFMTTKHNVNTCVTNSLKPGSQSADYTYISVAYNSGVQSSKVTKKSKKLVNTETAKYVH